MISPTKISGFPREIPLSALTQKRTQENWPPLSEGVVNSCPSLLDHLSPRRQIFLLYGKHLYWVHYVVTIDVDPLFCVGMAYLIFSLDPYLPSTSSRIFVHKRPFTYLHFCLGKWFQPNLFWGKI